VSLTATVSQTHPAPSGDEPCVAPSPCQASLKLNSVTFTQMPKFEVTPLELTWGDPTTGQTIAPTSNPQSAMAFAYELMPVQQVVNEGYQGTIDESTLENDAGGPGGNAADLDGLNLVYNWTQNTFDKACCKTTGDMHDMVVGFNVEIARGDTYINNEIGGINTTPVTDVYEPDAVVDAPFNVPVAHEMGHAAGRLHADHGCGGENAGGSDPDWPDYDGHLEPTENLANDVAPSSQTGPAGNSYGVNLAWRVPEQSGTGPFVIFPDTDYDIMSYCGNEWETNPSASDPGMEWTSPRGWEQEFTCLQEQPNPNCPVNEQQASMGEVKTSIRSSSAGARAQAASAGGGGTIRGPSISFIGYIAPGGSLMSPSLVPSQGGFSGAKSSPFTASLMNAKGGLVATEPLSYGSVHVDAAPGHPALALTAVNGFIPTHGEAVARLVIKSAGKVTERIAAPRTKPRVTVSKPRTDKRTRSLTIRWNSHDRSKTRRLVFIAFSTGGRRFKQIWEGFDRGRASIALTFFGRARQIRLEVKVSDGFTSSTATTKQVKLPKFVQKAITGPPPAWLVGLRRDGIQLVNP
jgi:hypothetical protein